MEKVIDTGMVELGRAVVLIAEQVYAGDSLTTPRARLFDSLAGTVSALVPLFSTDGGAPRQLAERELESALFRNGGSEMYFPDGRAPVTHLAVTSDGIARVIRILKGSSL